MLGKQEKMQIEKPDGTIALKVSPLPCHDVVIMATFRNFS